MSKASAENVNKTEYLDPDISEIGADRRQDKSTRNAIEKIQDRLFDPGSFDQIFNILIHYLSETTKSAHGICFLSDDKGLSPLSENQFLYEIYHGETPPFIDQSVLGTWIKEKSLLNNIVYYNSPIPKGTRALIKGNVDIKSLMIIPILLHTKLRAICVLAKPQKAYDASMMNQLKPILGAVSCTLQSVESVKGNFSGLDAKIADNEYLSKLISSSPIGVVVVSHDHTIFMSNPAAQDIFDPQSVNINEDEKHSLSGIKITSFFPNFERFFQWSNQKDKMGLNSDTHAPKVWENHLAYRKDGTPCLLNLSLFRHSHAGQRYTTLQIQDITFIQEQADEFKRTSQQLNALTQLAPVGIIHVDVAWNCVFANEKWSEFSGLSPQDSTHHNWINAFHPDDINGLLHELRKSMELGTDYFQELRLVTPSGKTKWIDLSVRILFDEDDKIDGFLGTCHDVTERYINQEKLRHIAEYDNLTGLANRMLFLDRLQQSFFRSQRDQSIITVFFLDLDGFKDVNDTLGHDVGDMLLQKVSERLLNTLRKNDTVARFGGDEFVVMLGHDDHMTEVIVVAEKVIECIAKPYLVENHEIFITTSLGIAQGSNKNSNPDIILKNADFALYNAKKEGKNKYQVFNKALEIGTQQRVKLLNDLRTGLSRNRFELYFEPICDGLTQRIIGFEALLRFKNKEDQIVQPDDFIPLLEESNLIVDVGKWVINEACKHLANWQDNKGFPTNGFVSFNVSGKQMLDPDLIPHISQACKSHKVEPKRLVMEMTESVIINKTWKVINVLNKLRQLGLRLALDDFGTGYSSLSYLQNMPFNILKIDKSFIDDWNKDSKGSKDTKIVKAIIALANSLELKIIAEGVENQHALEQVILLGAHLFQGYYVSKPLSSEDVLDFMLQYNSRTTTQ
ncbi:EAL domain-containing protein [Glaciecola sp. 2405UD65-10]|uniref:sensor domain-containing protein n=1 Tax=Glaciecola sp. 2405UD65-10 TaxID=3397244 RepID=UPI003B58FFF5